MFSAARQWTIHEHYKGDQREDAIEDAKAILAQNRNLDAVKVIKETLDPDTGIFNDAVIFKASAPKKKSPGKFTAAPVAEGSRPQARKKPSPEKRNRRKN